MTVWPGALRARHAEHIQNHCAMYTWEDGMHPLPLHSLNMEPGSHNRIKLCVLETASGTDKGLTVEDPGVPQSVRYSSQE